MTVAVARGVLTRIREDPGGIMLVVKGAADQEAATAALRAAAAEISGLDGGWSSAPGLSLGDTNTPKYVSEVLPTGLGPMVMIDGGHVPYHLLRTIPDIVVRHLETAGVDEALVACPREWGPLCEMLGQRDPSPRIVTLALYPPPPLRWRQCVGIPLAWLEEVAAWVGEGLDDTDAVVGIVVVVEFPVAPGAVTSLLAQVGRAGGDTVVASGELGNRIRGAGAKFVSSVPSIVLAGGGPATTEEELLKTFWALVNVARRVAPHVGYAHIGFDHIWRIQHAALAEWQEAGGERTSSTLSLCDEYVLDAYPYQVLGPGHLQTLGSPPVGGQPLEGGRVELSIGEPLQWLIDIPSESWSSGRFSYRKGVADFRRDSTIQQRARQALEPCLLREGEAETKVWTRWAKHGPLPPGVQVPPTNNDNEEQR